VISLIIDSLAIGAFYQKLSSAFRIAWTIKHSSRACICSAMYGKPMRFECRVRRDHTRPHGLHFIR
jgi:hypothetical protein